MYIPFKQSCGLAQLEREFDQLRRMKENTNSQLAKLTSNQSQLGSQISILIHLFHPSHLVVTCGGSDDRDILHVTSSFWSSRFSCKLGSFLARYWPTLNKLFKQTRTFPPTPEISDVNVNPTDSVCKHLSERGIWITFGRRTETKLSRRKPYTCHPQNYTIVSVCFASWTFIISAMFCWGKHRDQNKHSNLFV